MCVCAHAPTCKAASKCVGDTYVLFLHQTVNILVIFEGEMTPDDSPTFPPTHTHLPL